MKIETCMICLGRGGVGRSCGGVTLSYIPCNCCDGEGFIKIPENKGDEEQLELG